MGACLRKGKSKSVISPELPIADLKIKQMDSPVKRKKFRLTVIPVHRNTETKFKRLSDSHTKSKSLTALLPQDPNDNYINNKRTVIEGVFFKGHQQAFEEKMIKIDGKLMEIDDINNRGIG